MLDADPTAPLSLCLATQNQHKIAELRELFFLHAPKLLPKIRLLSTSDLNLHDEVVEDGADFAENARKKAEAAHNKSGLWALSDDSGLEVAALDGAPGLYSARYGGAPRPGQTRDARNREKLLADLEKIPEGKRQARFVCVLCLFGRATPHSPPSAILRFGACNGRLLFAEHGAGGFGYDPIFVPDEEELRVAKLDPHLAGRTYAELLSEEKNRLSHRARALIGMREALSALVEGKLPTDC